MACALFAAAVVLAVIGHWVAAIVCAFLALVLS